MGFSLITRESFDDVMRLYAPAVFRIAFARLADRADAEDVVQDVFVRYFKADKTFESELHRKHFLIRCAVNCANSYAKSSWRRHRAGTGALENLPEEQIKAESPEENSEKTERKNAVLNSVLALPEKYRTAVHLFYFEDLSVAQISSITGQNESTIKSYLHRAREKLRKTLDRDDFE